MSKTATKRVVCIYCWGSIRPQQDRLSIKDRHSGRLSWYHNNYEDCANGMRSGMKEVEDDGIY